MSTSVEIADEASRLVRDLAGPKRLGETSKMLIRRTARRLGWSYRRTKALFYREARRVEAHEMDALRKREKAADANLDIVLARLERVERQINALAGVQSGGGLSAGHVRSQPELVRRATK